MIPIALSTTYPDGGEYAAALREAGALPVCLPFDVEAIDERLAQVAGVLVSGGGDVDPRRYGGTPPELATEIDGVRDAFEIALIERARDLGLPTLCICRGLQIANVAFGGTLVVDIGTTFDAATAALHRPQRDGATERGIIPGHDVTVRPDSLLATIVSRSPIVTGSRHHQSIARVAADLAVVATAPDGIVEAVEARFASPFWLGVQWHPESTLELDDGAGRSIFTAFTAAARRRPTPAR